MPASGRTVRCGVCKHQWHALPEAAAAGARADFAALVADQAGASAASAETSSFQLPAIATRPLPHTPLIAASVAFALIWLVTAFYASYARWHNAPVLAPLYRMVGHVDTKGLKFGNTRMAREEEGQRTRFVISGEIANEAEDARRLPLVRVMLLDSEGEEIASRIYEVNKTIKAGESYPFRITNMSTSFGHRVERVVVDLGDDMQLSFR